MSEQYKCDDCGQVHNIEELIIKCPLCGCTSFEHLRWTKGGDGSHWEGCEDVHWDCKIAQLEAELARRDEIITRLKEDAERISKYCTHIPPPLDTGWKTPCTYGNCVCGRDNAITLHRALMKELEG